MFRWILAANIKTGGVISKQWKITKKKSEMVQSNISLSVQFALSKTGDTGAKRGVKHKSQNSRLARNTR